MANPPGTRANRWNQAVSAVATELGMTTTEADTWLNVVWADRWHPENLPVDAEDLAQFIKWAEFNAPTAATLNMAFVGFVT